MAKICSNCSCYEVCIFANPNRTEDCKIGWQPKLVHCKDCEHWDKKHMYIDQCWCPYVVGYRSGTWFCASGKERTVND
jgi:hypothetical protein